MTKQEALEIVKNTPWSFIIETLFEDGEILTEEWEKTVINAGISIKEGYSSINTPNSPIISEKQSKLFKEYLDNHLLETSDKETLLIFLEEAVNDEQFEWAEKLKNRINEL